MVLSILSKINIPLFTFDEYCRFWSKVRKTDTCWEWLADSVSDGYGRICLRQSKYLAHRVSYANSYGQPGELDVLHKCDNPKCVRPDHLFLGTDADNQQDKERKGRGNHLRGEDHPNHKLSDIDRQRIIEIKNKRELTHEQLARRYNVSLSLINKL
jgi:hypothetical protein